MKNSLGFLAFGSLLALLFFSGLSFAETTCTKGDCSLTITLKLAFQGADQAYMDRAKNEIESVWNGPNDDRTVEPCKCPIHFQVTTTTAQDCKNNPPAGYHCIMVTNYNNDPPRNQTNWTGAKFYIGYMYGVTSGNGGNSEKGWWSDIMSRPVDPNNPNGEHYKDFAHEAGHMMGLEDGDGGIMSRTSGPNSDPTQENINEIANDICGADACPNRCCCGNGQVDGTVNEKCDPMASPTGCGQGESCCPVCCSCFKPLCVPARGEYMSESSCQVSCGPGSSCYKNYKTGCWDCVTQKVVIHKTCRDPTNIRGNTACDHEVKSFVDQGIDFYENDLASAPVLGGLFANERINIQTEEGDEGYLVAWDGKISSYGDGSLTDNTVSVVSDRETLAYIGSKDMTVQQAISEGRLNLYGNGIIDGVRFGAYHLLFDIFNLFSPEERFEPPPQENEFPQEYYDEMRMWVDAPSAPSETMGYELGALPDDGEFGSDTYPE